MKSINKYRVIEALYDNGETLFFAQLYTPNLFNKNKWITIQNTSGYLKKETAISDIERYECFHNPPKPVKSKIHEVTL